MHEYECGECGYSEDTCECICYECGYSKVACVCVPTDGDNGPRPSHCPRCQEHYCDCH